ncbi:MAG: hypothetical protein WDO73_24970 [Ignavibacteriota bacterium]
MRFAAPAGTLTHWLEWAPERATLRTTRGVSSKAGPDVVAEHAFTSGIQAPGNEGFSFNLYALADPHNPLQHEFEVIVEKFEFLP